MILQINERDGLIDLREVHESTSPRARLPLPPPFPPAARRALTRMLPARQLDGVLRKMRHRASESRVQPAPPLISVRPTRATLAHRESSEARVHGFIETTGPLSPWSSRPGHARRRARTAQRAHVTKLSLSRSPWDLAKTLAVTEGRETAAAGTRFDAVAAMQGVARI